MNRPDVHETEHTITVAAPAGTVFALVESVDDWPHVFPPTLHVECLERAGAEERIRIWATANDQVKNWTSRRTVDREGLRIRFRQEVSRHPVASMGGEWIVEPLPDGHTRVRLTHDFRAVDDLPENVAWISRAVDRNSGAELAALKAAAERTAAERADGGRTGDGRTGDGAAFTFEDTVRVDAPAGDVHAFLLEAQLWQDRLPHVARVVLKEDTPDVQLLEMDTRTADGSTHTTSSIRICLPGRRIVYKQLRTPALMAAHTGCWTVTEDPAGSVVTSRHTVVIDPGAIASVLGGTATPEDARAFVRRALGHNSTTTMRHAKEYAEGRCADRPVTPATYASLQRFYAAQMRLLDDGEGQAWAGTFAEDGEFAQSAGPAPLRGRAAIAAAVRSAAGRARSARRRHFTGMLTARQSPDGSVRTRFYALVVDTEEGASPVLRLSASCQDSLAPEGDGWLVRRRLVEHDGR
ncbi:SRPBCC family protein [Streptomyces sp. NPDC001678]|uniref:SRPBCC family protein n=1 Tax=Streptomyces sp. NPDC001678 TaxID=3364599 RepID=UPI00368860F7